MSTATYVRERITLFYFSGTGNTRWAAEQFAEETERLGSRTQLVPITDDMEMNQVFDGVDVVGVAHPLYGGDLPPIVGRFYRRLSERYEGELLVILTYGYVNSLGKRGEGSRTFGIPIRWYAAVKLVNNITTPQFPAAIPSVEVRRRRGERAKRRLKALAHAVVGGSATIPSVAPAAIVGDVVRSIAAPRIREHYARIGVDRDRCVLCHLCVEQCPTGSITYTDRVFRVDDKCTACMRCYSSCPVQAITIGGEYADPKLYPRHKGMD